MTDPASIVAEVEARARRVETPCGDGTIVWRIWGEGMPLVLGHGASGSWTHWIRNIDALAASGRQVIAIDLPGYGDSALPEAETHDAVSAALAKGLIMILGADRKADFVGFSFSGSIFTNFALRYPNLAERIIIVGSGGLNTPHGKTDVRSVRGLEGSERYEALRRNLCGLMLHHAASADDLSVHLLATNARKARLKNVQGLILPDHIVRAMPDLEVPLDAIWGAFDRPHPDPEFQASVLRRIRPSIDFRVVPDAGHWVMYEQAQAFNATLIAMLEAGAPRL